MNNNSGNGSKVRNGFNSGGRGNNFDGSKNSDLNKYILYSLAGILVIILVVLLVFGINYLISDCDNKKDFTDYLFGLDLTDVCTTAQPVPTDLLGQGSGEKAFDERRGLDEEEVFLIGNQTLSYDQAKCKCSAYGAKLATYPQVVESYNKGADSCLYGWSEGQKAYYTTQKCTWDKLQKNENENDRNKCGMPGVNGGYFANPNLKFGALCYGVKPEGEVAVEKKPVCDKKPYCTRQGKLVEKEDSDVVAPFSGDKWSQF